MLTGAKPANSDPFLDFVTAAWDSLAEDTEQINWTRSVRRALKLYQGDWDSYELHQEAGIRLSFESRSLPPVKKRMRKT
jgi:hypothetical protein